MKPVSKCTVCRFAVDSCTCITCGEFGESKLCLVCGHEEETANCECPGRILCPDFMYEKEKAS